ncbi:ABC transporter permease [Spiroplasma endosymbiont of Nephrotoma flavescens]|uniref:ABC transporter permease n=1 Tax=Spiroplasma endosymbiont of Nephrotoma flavescens TaxID=3066302 RepID=UPI00313EAD91
MKILSSNNFLPIFNFALRKILVSLLTLIIEIITLLSLIITTLVLFIQLENDNDSFLVNFQYIILVFLNLLLFLFIVLNVVRIISEEITDGTFLLLISKPYSRFKILFSKYLSLLFVVFLFIAINLGIAILLGYIISTISNKHAQFVLLLNMMTKLMLFSLFLSFVVLAGSVLTALIFSSNIVFLILVVFSSMFLLGGLPYSLIKEISNKQTVNIGADTFDINNIKEIILFNDAVKKPENNQTNIKIRYSKLVTKIFNFYNKYEYEQLTARLTEIDNKRRAMYKKFDLYTDEIKTFTAEGSVTRWTGDLTNELKDKNVKLHIQFKTYFKTLEQLDTSNEYQYELIQLINNNLSPQVVELTKDKNVSLMEIDIDKSNSTTSETYIEVKNKKMSNWNPFTVFRENYNYEFDEKLSEKYNDLFSNKVYFAIQELDNNILVKVRHLKLLTNQSLSINKNWADYQSLMKTYRIISFLNLFEHWNQMWTTFLGFNDFFFSPTGNSYIDFDKQKNYLNSYRDFEIITNNKGQIEVQKINHILNSTGVAIGYGIFAMLLNIGSVLVIKRRDIV